MFIIKAIENKEKKTKSQKKKFSFKCHFIVSSILISLYKKTHTYK